MHVELRDGIHWIAECSEVNEKHMHTAVYLLETPSGNILIDTGSHTHQAPLQQTIESVVGSDGVDAIVISHPDLPHSGNVSHFQEIWDGPEIVSSVATPPVVGLPDRTRATIGSETDVLGRRITFADPPLADIVFSTWPFDHEANVLFSIDGFGTYHEPGECTRIIDTQSSLPTVDEIKEYHAETFRWLEFVDPEKITQALQQTFTSFEASYVAPTHGSPIVADQLPDYLDRLTDAVEKVSKKSL
jgi:flavorubredoxin